MGLGNNGEESGFVVVDSFEFFEILFLDDEFLLGSVGVLGLNLMILVFLENKVGFGMVELFGVGFGIGFGVEDEFEIDNFGLGVGLGFGLVGIIVRF